MISYFYSVTIVYNSTYGFSQGLQTKTISGVVDVDTPITASNYQTFKESLEASQIQTLNPNSQEFKSMNIVSLNRL